MGAVFSHLAQAARGRTGGVGRALCLNTLGASMAPLVFGVWLLPATGAKYSLLVLSVGYILLIPARRWTLCIPAVVPLAMAAFIWFQLPGFSFVHLKPGSRIAAHLEGIMADVTVIEDPRGDYHLKVNNKFLMGGTASGFSDKRQGHLPLLMHPHPKRALFLGLEPELHLPPPPSIPVCRPTAWSWCRKLFGCFPILKKPPDR